MFKINPYRPGAGVRPQYLAGRDEDIENVTNMFTALTLNIPTQSVGIFNVNAVNIFVTFSISSSLPAKY